MQGPSYPQYPGGQPPYYPQQPGGQPPYGPQQPGVPQVPGQPYNPYASPHQQPYGGQPRRSMPLATRGQRFLNFFIDNIVMSFLQMICICPVSVMTAASMERGTSPEEAAVTLQVVVWIASLVVFLGYYIFFEAVFQRTPGKFLTGTMVLRSNGVKPTFGQVLGRTLARFIPFEPFSFLFSELGWHDTLSGTQVVQVR